MTEINQIKEHNLNIIKSIHAGFKEEAVNTPVIKHDKFEDLQKSHDIYTQEKLDAFVKGVQDEFIKGLDANEDVDGLKKGLEQAQAELEGLEKAILINEEGKQAVVFCRKKA